MFGSVLVLLYNISGISNPDGSLWKQRYHRFASVLNDFYIIIVRLLTIRLHYQKQTQVVFEPRKRSI